MEFFLGTVLYEILLPRFGKDFERCRKFPWKYLFIYLFIGAYCYSLDNDELEAAWVTLQNTVLKKLSL